jgi:hypothetical protein
MAALPRSWIDALFLRFSSYYGEQFISKWKHTDIEQTKNDWAEALWKYDSATLKAALEYCREESKYPPSLPEFVQMCKNAKPVINKYALGHKFEKSPRASQFIADMKKMLEKGKV